MTGFWIYNNDICLLYVKLSSAINLKRQNNMEKYNISPEK